MKVDVVSSNFNFKYTHAYIKCSSRAWLWLHFLKWNGTVEMFSNNIWRSSPFPSLLKRKWKQFLRLNIVTSKSTRKCSNDIGRQWLNHVLTIIAIFVSSVLHFKSRFFVFIAIERKQNLGTKLKMEKFPKLKMEKRIFYHGLFGLTIWSFWFSFLFWVESKYVWSISILKRILEQNKCEYFRIEWRWVVLILKWTI